jgi:tryptophan synthase beta chain
MAFRIRATQSESYLPTHWYNISTDLPRPLPPPRDPDAAPSRVELLNALLPPSLIDQEFTFERFVKIPDEVIATYLRLGRPTPLVRAARLEKHLGTRARIYYKFEGVLPSGSHKVNTAVAQAYFTASDGFTRLTTETGAGQWGTAMAMASSMFGIRLKVFMTRSSYLSKRGRVSLMRIYGAEVVPSPSEFTETGSRALRDRPDHPGSLGLAISEAIEYVLRHEDTRYVPGSVMEYVLMHQTVIGQEAMAQLRELGEDPTVIVGCVGGGSNFAGLAYPFIGEEVASGRVRRRYIAVESSSVPKMTRGTYGYEHPDSAGYLPMLKMLNVGRDYVPPPIHASGLRYHAVAPSLSILIRESIVEPRAYGQEEIMEAALLFSRVEGIVPAPESAHAIRAVIDEARRAGDGDVILMNLSGHGLLDLDSYEKLALG